MSEEPGRISRTDAGWALAVATLAAALCVPVYRLWETNLSTQWRYGGDANFYAMLIKSMDDGWQLQSNPRLGVPFGQSLLDVPVGGDNLHLAMLKVMTLFSSNYAVVMNVFFLLTFATAAGTMFLVSRRIGVSSWLAAGASLVFAFLPYHVMRSEGHLFLSSYFAIPLGGLLIWKVLDGRPLLRRREGAGPRALRWASATSLGTLAIVVIAASTGVYYAAFTAFLIAAAALTAFWRFRDRRSLWVGLAIPLMILAVLAANLSPNIIQRIDEGPNTVVAERAAAETEVYAFNLARLVFPFSSHRVDALADFGESYARQTPLPAAAEGTGYLGVVTAVAFLVVAIIALGRALGAGGSFKRHSDPSQFGGMALLAFAVGTTGGLASLFAFTITPELHGANRIILYLAFFSLVGGGLAADLWLTRIKNVHITTIGVPIGVAAIVALALVDQAVPVAETPAYLTATKADVASDRAFVDELERQTPHGAWIYQLPYVPFPYAGAPAGTLIEYDMLRGYLNSRDLRWSYGAVVATDEDWPASLSSKSYTDQATAVGKCGFAGIYVDRHGFADGGVQVEKELRAVLGPPRVESANRRLAFYATRYSGDPEAALEDPACDSVFRPIHETWGAGFYPEERTGSTRWRWANATAVLDLSTPGRHDAPIVFTAVASTATGSGTLVIQPEDGTSQRIAISSRPRQLRITIPVRHGGAHVVFATDAPRLSPPGDPRDLRFALYEATAEPLG